MENFLRHARVALSVAMRAKSRSGLEFGRLDLASSGSLLTMTREQGLARPRKSLMSRSSVFGHVHNFLMIVQKGPRRASVPEQS